MKFESSKIGRAVAYSVCELQPHSLVEGEKRFFNQNIDTIAKYIFPLRSKPPLLERNSVSGSGANCANTE